MLAEWSYIIHVGPGLHIQDQGHLERTAEHLYAMTEVSQDVFQLR